MGADAKAAYSALIDFTNVVKAHPTTPASTVSGGSISSAAGKLSAAAYPLIQDVDWTSDLFSKSIPGKSPQDVMKAVDKMIVMGSAMDGAALKEAAQAHVKAIEGVDAKGVLSQADFEAINAGVGKAIASVPTSKVMDVYNAMAGVIGNSPVPNYLYSQVNPQDAQAAYNALLEFKDVVRRPSAEPKGRMSAHGLSVHLDVQSIWTCSHLDVQSLFSVRRAQLCTVYSLIRICLT